MLHFFGNTRRHDRKDKKEKKEGKEEKKKKASGRILRPRLKSPIHLSLRWLILRSGQRGRNGERRERKKRKRKETLPFSFFYLHLQPMSHEFHHMPAVSQTDRRGTKDLNGERRKGERMKRERSCHSHFRHTLN